MSISVSLLGMFGKPVAEKLISALQKKKNGAQRLEEASEAMAAGATAVEALKKAFGDDFLAILTDSLDAGQKSAFDYEAGVSNYIKIKSEPGKSAVKVLRDELNVNLDRLALAAGKELHNQFRGAFSVWKDRYHELLPGVAPKKTKEAFDAIDQLLDGRVKSFKDLYKLLARTSLGGAGALLIISGVCLATSTGVGVVTAISTFLFGIPWMAVGILVLPGALMLMLASWKLRGYHVASACIGIAYKHLDSVSKL